MNDIGEVASTLLYVSLNSLFQTPSWEKERNSLPNRHDFDLLKSGQEITDCYWLEEEKKIKLSKWSSREASWHL